MATTYATNASTSSMLVRRFARSAEPESLPPYDGLTTDPDSLPSDPSFAASELDGAVTTRSDNAFISSVIASWPSDEHTWIRDLERPPESALRRSFVHGHPQQEVIKDAPTLRVGITFLSGADRATVVLSEQSLMNKGDRPPHLQSPQWLVYTAAQLLHDIEVDAELKVNRKDVSERIVNNRKSLPAPPTSPERSPSSSSHGSGENRLRKPNIPESSNVIVRREKKHHPLTIDSDEVKLYHEIISEEEKERQKFDMTSTLIEIDMLSMKALIEHYNKIIADTGKQMSQAETVAVLDTMIGDVRRLCARSPRLFRMATRAVIAESKEIRYGVDFGNVFTTVTTSEGIRHLVERGSGFYQSLSDDKVDQSYVRPRFLQMVVLLLSMLNNKDLELISNLMESTYQIPGDRVHLELLIMKVLPLLSINSEIFLRSFFAAYKPMGGPKPNYQIRVQQELWKELQRDIARKGFIVPSVSKASAPSDTTAVVAQADLEDGWGDEEDDGLPEPAVTGSWISDPPRGFEGLKSSAVFKYLQHDGKLRNFGAKGSVRAINEIPHLELLSDSMDDRVTIVFRNNATFKVYPEDAEKIQTMNPDVYPLEPVQGGSGAQLHVEGEALNDRCIRATDRVNQLLQTIRDVLGNRASQSRSLLDRFASNFQTSVAHISNLDVPPEAMKVTATIRVPHADGLNQDRTIVAVAFKSGNRVVFQHIVVKAMTDSLNKLRHAVKWVETQKSRLLQMKTRPAEQAFVKRTVTECNQELADIQELIEASEWDLNRIQQMQQDRGTDPIQKIKWPGFDQVHGDLPDWQAYESALDKNKDILRMMARKLEVVAVEATEKDAQFNVMFSGVSVQLTVELLSFGGTYDAELSLMSGSIVAWAGHYLIVLEELSPSQQYKYPHVIQGYFRVLAQNFPDGTSRKTALRNVPLSRIEII